MEKTCKLQSVYKHPRHQVFYPLLNFMSACVVQVWLATRVHVAITQLLTPACPIYTLHWWGWKLIQPSPGQLHRSWWWGNLSVDSSLKHLPDSILITSQTEIRKKKWFWLFPSSPLSARWLSPPAVPSSRIISNHGTPDGTFQYSSWFQIAEIELSLQTLRLLTQLIWCRQKAQKIVKFRLQYQDKKKKYFRHCLHPQQSQEPARFPDSSICPQVAVTSGLHCAATVHTPACGVNAVSQVNISQCCCVRSIHRNTDCWFGCKLETIWSSLLLSGRVCIMSALWLWEFSAARTHIVLGCSAPGNLHKAEERFDKQQRTASVQHVFH